MFKELGARFDLKRALNFGLIPSIYFSAEPLEDLKAYIGEYLREEVAAESAVRNIPAFSRFLEFAAMCHGCLMNYSSIASDAQVSRNIVHEYFQILRDTFVGYDLPAFRHTVKRKPISTTKFYFFDSGVVRCLQQRLPMAPRSPEFGEAFESFIFHELRTYADYHSVENLNYWRSTSQFEVDFILNGRTAIEVKAKENPGERDLRGLKAMAEEKICRHYLLVCLGKVPRRVDGCLILGWQEFLKRLWDGEWS